MIAKIKLHQRDSKIEAMGGVYTFVGSERPRDRIVLAKFKSADLELRLTRAVPIGTIVHFSVTFQKP